MEAANRENFQREIFDRRVDFEPASVDFEAFLKSVPAKWVVYLMCDAGDRPVQLLCVKNLRYSLERRLRTGEEPEGPSRRVNYREIVRHVYWRRVDSAFEADIVYLEAARRIFPQTYRGMTGLRPAWFVHVNPQATFPRYVKTNDPTGKTGVYFGPVEDKHAAEKLVHLVEGAFDLCRDYSVLTQAPRGGPCAWKQMGKCVGPCDGSVSLGAYRQLVAHTAQALGDPHDYARQQSGRMKQAAAALEFETAAKIKQWVEQWAQIGKGVLRHVRPLEQFAYVTLQRGPRAGTAKVFLITPGRVEEIAGVIAEPKYPADLLRHILGLAYDRRQNLELDEPGAERLGMVSHHLFQPKARQGVFVPLDSIDEKVLAKSFRDLMNQKPQDESPGEGVTKELQAL